MVRQRTHSRNRRTLLSTTQTASYKNKPRKLAPGCLLLPQPAGRVPKDLPLCRKVPVASGYAEEKAVVGCECGRILENGDVGVFRGGVHFGQDGVGEGFRELKNIARAADCFDALCFGLGEGGDVAPGEVLWDYGKCSFDYLNDGCLNHTYTIAILGVILLQ